MLAAPMRHDVSSCLLFALFCLASLLPVGCVGGVGTSCFQDGECNGALTCCKIGSVFSQGQCETQEVCAQRQGGGGTGGDGGTSGTGGSTGGAGGDGGSGGAGGAAGAAGSGGAGGMSGAGGMGGGGMGGGGMSGAGGQGGMGGQPAP